MASYDDMARTVLDFYTNPDDLLKYGGWQNVFDPNKTYSLTEAYEAIKNNPDIHVILREDGTISGWYSKSTGSGNVVSNIGSAVNSNTVGGVTESSSIANIQTSPTITEVSPGHFKVANAGATAGGRWVTNGGVGSAIMVAATGLSLGVTIDKALYAAKPGFLSDEQLETLNPENWKQISTVVDEQWTAMGYPTIGKIGRKVFDTILGIDSTDNSTQMYIDEDAYAYAAWYLQQQGVWASSESIDYSSVDQSTLYYPNNYLSVPVSTVNAIYTWHPTYPPYVNTTTYTIKEQEDTVYFFNIPDDSPDNNNVRGHAVSLRPFTIESNGSSVTAKSTTSHGIKIYACFGFFTWGFGKSDITPNRVSLTTVYDNYARKMFDDVAYLVLKGQYISGRPDGIGDQTGATKPNLSTATDLESFKTLLKQQYPDVWTNSVTRDVLQPDGTLKTLTYVPVPTPNATDWMDTEPTGDGSQQSQKDTVVQPDMNTSIKDTISSSGSTGTTTPNPPDTGGGDSPTVVPPVGKASSLWSIYNPTLEQVNQFGSWLWSSDFVEQLKKLFSDPMQAIIGLHKVYSPVQTSGAGTIKCGYLDSAVPSKLVSEQYVTVDCGSVDLQEYFGNVFDYPPYTEVSIYLPFIGVRQLDPSDVMRSTISVKYHVDVLTGACLAEVNVQRDAAGGTLYTFSGDAAVRYPVSSGSYMGIVSGLIGVATSIVSGNLLPALGGATRLHTNVDRSGSFTGNSGAMGSKIPYLIISRPQTAMADNFETLSGYPSNTYTPLSACSGYTQVRYVHVENLTATDAEKQEIERLLKEGVIL